MRKPIRRAAVIGAGVMGSGIAAHLANAGIEVLLMDIVPPNLTDAEKKNRAARNRFASSGLEKAIKARPAAFFSKDRARLVSIGNVEDDLEKLAAVDLVVEAIIEQVEPKRALFEKVEKVVKSDCIVASNTSGLRITEMMAGRSASFRQRFLVMHFFNPVRYMKLLELVAGPDTSAEALDRIRGLGEDVLGKGVVVGKDTPNFVGNRIGCHAMLTTIHLMLEEGLAPEDVDGITGEPIGHPKSASFRTADLVGVDTFVHVADNCYASLTADEDRKVFETPAFIRAMVEKKLLGDKTRGGFYRKGKDGSVETLDPKTLEYRPRGGDKEIRAKCKELVQIEDVRDRVRKLFADDGKAGRFAWKVLSRSLAYSARRIGEITDDITAIDEAMRWGYNWELGPFETWDAIGFEVVLDRMKKDGVALPASIDKMRASGAKSFYTADGKVFDLLKVEYKAKPADPRTVALPALRKGSGPVLKNDGAAAWDLGDGVLGLTFTTKANSIDSDVIKMIEDAVAKAETDFRALVVANQGEHFCVGANLLLVVMAAQAEGVGADPLDGEGLPARLPADEVRHRPGRRGPVRNDARRRSRGVSRRRRRAGCRGDVRGPRRGRGGSRPRRGRHDEPALARARGHAGRGHPRHLRARHPDVQEHRDGARRDERRGGEDLRVLPAHGRRELRSRTAAGGREGEGDRPGAERVAPSGAARVRLARRERDGHSGDDDRHAGRRGPGEPARREDRGQARRDPLRRRVRRGPRGHRRRDARDRARGVPESLRRDQEPGTHAVHAHEQQASPELVPGAPAPYPGNGRPPISWYPANFNRSKPLWRGTRKTAEGGPSPTSHPAARRSSPFEECAHVRPSDALPVRGHPRPDRFRRAGEWERTEYGPRHDSCA